MLLATIIRGWMLLAKQSCRNLSLGRSKRRRPFSRAMDYAQHFDSPLSETVGNHIGRARYYKFACPTTRPFCPAAGNMLRISIELIILSAVSCAASGFSRATKSRTAFRSAIARRPIYVHSGGLRSRLVPQLASHLLTSSLPTNCAAGRSASSIPALISAICHSLSSIYARIASAARKDLVRAVALASFPVVP